MSVNATGADLKAPGELAVGPLFSNKKDGSASTSSGKDSDKEELASSCDELPGTDHGVLPPPTYQATFEGDKTFYMPIERYEGRHRYDPDFQWEPKEEKKLVRKVSKVFN